MLEGFAVRKYPDWEKVGYDKFDVGFFSRGKLNGYAKEYMLEPIFQNNKRVGGYERITVGYYENDLLNGIGIKIEDDEIIEYGFYENDRLIDLDRLMHDNPMAVISNFYINDVYQGEVLYYGECLNGRRGTGRGVIVDRKERMIIGNFVDNELIPGMYIQIYKGKISFDFVTYDDRSAKIANIFSDSSYRPAKEEEALPKKCFACYGEDENYSEGYFDENGLMQGLGFKNDARESGIYKDDVLIFGSVDRDASTKDIKDFLKNKYMLFPKDIKVKKLKYKEGTYIGEVENDVPNGYGQYFCKSDKYKDIMEIYKQRERRNIFIGNTKSIPEDIKYGDVCYIATFKKGKMEGYCTRWIYSTIDAGVDFCWTYDEGIIAYNDRFKPEMSLFEYYGLRYSKFLREKNVVKDVFDLNNRAHCAYFLRERLVVDSTNTLLYDIKDAKYLVKENSDNEYELWIFLSIEDNKKYKDINESYILHLQKCGFRKIKEKTFLQESGLFEIEILDEGRNIRLQITKNFR